MTHLEQAKAFLAEAGAAFPDPWMGEPFTHASITQELDTQVIRYGPPCRPIREVYEWDDAADDEIYVRTKSNKEFSNDLAKYRRDMEQWSKDRGQRIVVNGPPQITGVFRTAGGAECEGIWTGDDWLWKSWRES